MTPTSNYYDLLFNIETSDYKLTWLENDPKYRDEFIAEKENNHLLKKELDNLQSLLLRDDNDADKIRIGYIYISNGILKAFSQIERFGTYYPDLSQGMVIPGYLFGLVLNDYKTNLMAEGDYFPVAHFYMSEKEWPVADLKNLLALTKQELMNVRFNCKMDAINFYQRIRENVRRQMHILRELRII